jgi:hypothetical protein
MFSYELLDGRDKHSFVTITWMTNMEKKFFLHRSREDIPKLYNSIRYYNSICEDERNDQGHDDEPEDEVALL